MPMQEPPGKRQVWHNDEVHAEEHKKWANGDTMQQMIRDKPEIEPWLTAFIESHEQAIMEKEMAMAMATVATTPGAKGLDTPGGQAMKNSNRESGNPADVPRGTGQGAQGQGPA
jgi:hypothetical protein